MGAINKFVNVVCLLLTIGYVLNVPLDANNGTTILKKDVQPLSYIDIKVMKEPKNLFIGRCAKDAKLLHSENIVLLNDKKGQINATILVHIDGPVKISCVKFLDGSADNTTAYPYFIDGGVGYNYVQVGIITGYGEGFNFYVEIRGYGAGRNASASQVYVNSIK